MNFSVYYFVLKNNILVDEIECGGPSPLGAGLLLTKGSFYAGSPIVIRFVWKICSFNSKFKWKNFLYINK